MQSTSSAYTKDDQPGWLVPLALSALIFCVYLFLSTCSTIWDRDEARFARATAEMTASGNYLFATFNGKLRPDKPILIYWLMSVPVRLIGHTEWAYRLCSVLGTTLVCFFTFLIGRSLFNRRTGLWAMALLATNPLMAYTGAVATSDAVLLAFMTGMFAVFADALKSDLKFKHAAALAFLFSGGMLTKGPVALLPAIPFIVTRIMLRRELGSPMAAILKVLASVAVSIAAFAAWFFPADAATHGELYNQMFVHHLAERMIKPLENHGGYSPLYVSFYFIVIVLSFFPWTLYLPAALKKLLSRARSNPEDGMPPNAQIKTAGRPLLLSWIVTILAVMIAISTKLPHYILPMWPALALSVAAYLDGNKGEDEPSAGWVGVLGAVIFMGVALSAAAGIGFGPEYVAAYAKKPDPLWLPFGAESHSLRSVIGALCVIVAIPVLARYRSGIVSNAKILLAAALGFFILAGTLLLPSFETIKISQRLAVKINTLAGSVVPVTVCGYNEASLLFYLNRKVDDIIPEHPVAQPVAGVKPGPKADPLQAAKKVEQAVIDWAAARGAGVLVIPRPMYEKYKSDPGVAALIEVADVNGFNYSKGHWVDVLALRRRN